MGKNAKARDAEFSMGVVLFRGSAARRQAGRTGDLRTDAKAILAIPESTLCVHRLGINYHGDKSMER